MRNEAKLVLGVLASTAMLYGARIAHSQEVSPDVEVESQLHGASADDPLTLNNPKIGYLLRLPWVQDWGISEADVALITSDEGKFLGFATQVDCVRKAFTDHGTLKPTFFPGVYHPDERLQNMEATTRVPAIFPTRPIVRSDKITYGDNEYDCQQEGIGDDLNELIKKVDENLPDLAEGGARRVSSVARALYRGLTESR